MFSPIVLAWNDKCVVKLARAAYFDTSVLPVIADALEEAGYTDGKMIVLLRKGFNEIWLHGKEFEVRNWIKGLAEASEL